MDSIYQQRRIQLAKENELNNFLKQQQNALQQQANETDNFNIEKCESQTRQSDFVDDPILVLYVKSGQVIQDV